MSARAWGLKNEVKKRQKGRKREKRDDGRGKREEKGYKKSVLETLGSPWDVQKELPGATRDIDPAAAGLTRTPHPPPYKSTTWGLRGSEG